MSTVLIGDVEEDAETSDVTEKTYTNWSREAILALISLYKDKENDFENPLLRKKIVWKEITQKMVSMGHNITQNKIECKWRNLFSSHQAILLNKNKTGARRKSFQFFEEMNEILRKRHDINPPFVSGSGCTATSTPKKKKIIVFP